MVRSTEYTIIVRGRLSDRFASAFPGVLMEPDRGQTRIKTEPLDQSQLHGLLDRLRNLAIELVSIYETSPAAGPVSQPPTSSRRPTGTSINEAGTHDRPEQF